MEAFRFCTAEISRLQVAARRVFDVDCDSLRRIEFGEGSFVNDKSAKARLSLENLPHLDEVLFRSASFLHCHELRLSSSRGLNKLIFRLSCAARSRARAGRRPVLLFPHATRPLANQSVSRKHLLSEAKCDPSNHAPFLECLFSNRSTLLLVK